MMFKKGSFEISCTVYPVAIKVRTAYFFLWCAGFAVFNSSGCCFGSMTLVLVKRSGTAASLGWWTTCCTWWAVGPLCVASGTFHQWAAWWVVKTCITIYTHCSSKFGVSKIKKCILLLSRDGERWSWRAGVPAEFSSNPNQTHLKQLIRVFRMQLGNIFLVLELNSAGTPALQD